MGTPVFLSFPVDISLLHEEKTLILALDFRHTEI